MLKADVVCFLYCLFCQVVKCFILPVVRFESDKLYAVIDGPLANNADRIAAEHTKAALLVKSYFIVNTN